MCNAINCAKIVKMRHNRVVNQTFMGWLIVVLHMLIAEEAILFPVVARHMFALNM